MQILISGGAGFVGSQLVRQFRMKYPKARIVAFDNLKRRGSELNLPWLKKWGAEFSHGDLRIASDLEDLEGNFNLFIEASAEPSVLAGLNGNPNYAIQTNLSGTLNALEFARKRCEQFLFLSTSRVYSIPSLRGIKLQETPTRFELETGSFGVTRDGISEEFSTSDYRSIYGATKLASELLIQEYAHTYNLRAMINRCGVIAGPGQFGKVDQGVFTLWIARHYFKQPLKYTGFGGTGKQVRDLLHPEDLFDLIEKQLSFPQTWTGEVFNIGGGAKISTSLLEWSALCREATGNEVKIDSDTTSASVDIPYYISDYRKASAVFGWKPKCSPQTIVKDTCLWIKENETQLKPLFSGV